MWERKVLKKKGWDTLCQNFWRILGISLLVAFIASGMKITYHITDAAGHFVGNRFELPTNAEIARDWFLSIREGDAPGSSQALDYMQRHYTPRRGILAQIYNRITEDKSVLYGFLNALNDMMFKERFGQGVIILAGVILLLLFLIFVSNVLKVGQCRFMLETCHYPNSRLGRLLFPWRVRSWRTVADTMFRMSLFLFLWDLTIVGGIAKRYSYKMVPYILAENPALNSREVFRISRQMMRGYKWKAFGLDLSFIGWHVLNFFAFGMLRWFFLNPYLGAVYAQMYFCLRQEALAKEPGLTAVFNDTALCGETENGEYPVKAHPLARAEGDRWLKIDYHREYSPLSMVFIFFAFSFVGWIWEVSLHLFGDGVFVNRGFFHGPWLPIYGTGGVLILLLLRRFVERPLTVFVLSMSICGLVEYLAGWFLWETQNMYWWNYTGYFLNLHGRICAEGLLVFGLGGCGFLYVLAPLLDEIFRKIPRQIALLLCLCLLAALAADGAYSLRHANSGEGITDYEQRIQREMPPPPPQKEQEAFQGIHRDWPRYYFCARDILLPAPLALGRRNEENKPSFGRRRRSAAA